MEKETKTNVMRILDKNNIFYNTYDYEKSKIISGKEASEFLKIDKNKMFKTLVTVSGSKKNFVFLVPVFFELDLKKAAKSVNEKFIEMILEKDLFKLTGYVHGGCSPIGMKKKFKTIIDITAKNFDTIVFSAGKIGHSVEMNVSDINKIISDVEFFDIHT